MPRSARATEGPIIASLLTERGTTVEAILTDTLAALDVEGRLREAGLAADDVAALRRRLVQLAEAPSAGAAGS